MHNATEWSLFGIKSVVFVTHAQHGPTWRKWSDKKRCYDTTQQPKRVLETALSQTPYASSSCELRSELIRQEFHFWQFARVEEREQ